MIFFTQKKFLSLPLRQQHKKAFELLRNYYESSDMDLLIQYKKIQEWLALYPCDFNDKKQVSDRIHDHLKEASMTLKEHNLLSFVRTHDNTETKRSILPISIYLDNIRSAHNVGSMIRTTEAFQLGTLYFSKKTPFIDHKQVQKTSMNTYQWVVCHNHLELNALPRPVIAMETSNQAKSIYSFNFPKVFTLVLGNEEYGCSDEVLAMADDIVEIPLVGRKNSLNVASAFAILASEIFRTSSANLPC